MPTNISSRVTLILVVLAAALWALFPSAPKALLAPFKKDVEWSFKHNLRAGIDMVGGTSLTYEIKSAGSNTELAQEVMEALKKRVDPLGQRNLIWRPQGGNRLEIQLPLTSASGEARARRDAYAQAQRTIEETNVRLPQVIDAVQDTDANRRRDRLNALTMGNTQRAELFGAMASTWDQIQAARAARDAARQAELEIQFDDLKVKLDATNLTVADLETALSLQPAARLQRLAEFRERFTKQGMPGKVGQIDDFVKAYESYDKYRAQLDDAGDIKRLLRGSGVLEFHILVGKDELQSPDARTMIERLAERGPRVEAGDTMHWYEVARPGEFSRFYDLFSPKGSDKKYVLAWAKSGKQMVNGEGLPRWALARVYRQSTELGIPVVGFEFDLVGARLFSQLTGDHVGQALAVVLDDKVITAPNIKTQIGAQGSIDGGEKGFSPSELRYLINTLSAGSLPAQLADEPISERTVGPQLGKDNLRAGLIACVVGLFVVAVFLIGYYYLSGIVAMIAVSMNLILILGATAALPGATITLPGVAGIVLTIGMAVDANVLIFERLREEQLRGMGIRLALRNAYDRAWSAILDGNVTTGITSFFLLWLGSEEVKGFGLTLLLGIVSSLFTSLFVTRTIFAVLVDKFGVKKLGSIPMSFPRWDKLLRPNVDWMKLAPGFYAFSTIFIVLGLILFGIKWHKGQILDVEFAKGTAAQFELREPMKIEDVRSIIEAASRQNSEQLPTPSVVSVGADEKTYEVVTPNDNAVQVKDVLKLALQGKLNLQEPSSFEMVGKGLSESINRAVFPIEPGNDVVGGLRPAKLRDHIGGVAIVLKDVAPMLKEDDIRKRIDQQRLQVGNEMTGYRKIDVEAFPDTRSVVVLVSDEALPYDKDAERWTSELASPTWKLVNDAINNPVELQKVSNFSPQIAAETQTEALLALISSCVVIMGYIWVRFGNLKYGTATIVALLHDTLFVLAGVGVAHYVAEISFFRDTLLIEPFRINLTMVAAILTVMGYSMNDTVVVFDRVRENRGKHGTVDRQLINDSINQTLSRTLLTGGTTLITILFMYITGGSGIHGFTFALLVGIIVGTYSSIAIASPLLLIGNKQAAGATPKPPQDRMNKPAALIGG